jgi:hypothetical protein
MSKIPKRKYPITTDNVNNLGGKELILKRMVNHYAALTNIKPRIDMSKPFEFNKDREPLPLYQDIKFLEEYLNVRETYKKVSKVKHYIDNKAPETIGYKKTNQYRSCKEKYDDIEHKRRLEAMSKRILSLGKPHERKKNKDDPIANPTYFFRSPNIDEKSTKLISLDDLRKKYKQLNENEKNKLLLNDVVYKTINQKKPASAKKRVNTEYRPKTTIGNTKKMLHIDIDPKQYIDIHLHNREKKDMDYYETEPQKISTKQKLLNKRLQYPRHTGNDKDFENDILQFIIQNNIASDEEFDCFEKELIERNKEKRLLIKSIIQKIKDALDGDDD